MDTTVRTAVVILLFALASYASALSCYQCNVECRTNTSCPNATTDPLTNSTRVSCDTPAEVHSCAACMKIQTVYRRYNASGKFIVNEVVTSICQKTTPPYTYDRCDEHGAGWSPEIICYCYSDYCNAARSLQGGALIPLLTLILYALL